MKSVTEWTSFSLLKGAEIIYTRFLRPRLLEAQNDIDKGADRLRQKVGDAVSDITSKQDWKETIKDIWWWVSVIYYTTMDWAIAIRCVVLAYLPLHPRLLALLWTFD